MYMLIRACYIEPGKCEDYMGDWDTYQSLSCDSCWTQDASLKTRVLPTPNGGQDLAQPAERQDDRERADTIWGGPDLVVKEEVVCLDLFRAVLIAGMVFATIYGQ